MLFVFDVDGTLSFDGTKIAEPIVDAIKGIERQGHEIAFASARPIRDLTPIIPDFKAEHLLIGGNGSIVQTKEGKIEVITPIDSDSLGEIKHVIKQYALSYIVDDVWNFSAKVDSSNKIYKQLDPDNLAENIELEAIESPIKIILLNVPDVEFDALLLRLKRNTSVSVVAHSGENSIDITARGINKFSTLRKFYTDGYNAFGNDSNDFELLKNANKSIWVGGKNERLGKLNLVPDYIVDGSVDDVSNLIKEVANA